MAALQALRNNNNHTKSVTSVLSKTHLQNLEANSVSVIPIENTKSLIQQSPKHQQQQGPMIQVKNLTQLQQHLETAAVLMDISKKVIISPPSSNPQSPSLASEQQTQTQVPQQQQQSNHNQQSQPQSIKSSVIKVCCES